MSARRTYRFFVLSVFMATACLCSTAQAQRLHNQKKEEEARQALTQAEEISSAALFASQLKNLMVLEEQGLNMVVMDARRNTRQAINSFTTWEDVFLHFDTIKNDLAAVDARARQRSRTVQSAQGDLKRKLEEARAALAALRENANKVSDESLSLQFAGLSDFEPATTLISQLFGTPAGSSEGVQIEALDKTTKVFAELADLYKKVNTRVKQIQDLKDTLGDFNESLQKIALQSLELEAEHLKILAAIEVRRGIELADARLVIEQLDAQRELLSSRYYGNCFKLSQLPSIDKERIVKTFELARNMQPCNVQEPSGRLTELDGRDAVNDIMQILFMTTIITSRVPLSLSLHALRTAQEEHRYSMKRRSLQANAYELTLTAGAQRLALFYKGGIKPSQVAQLINNVANIATPFTIAAR